MRGETETYDKLLGKVIGYVEDNVHRPIWEMADKIKVKIIDWKYIIDTMKLADNDMKDLNLEIKSGNGIIFVPSENNPDEKIPVLIDNECCGVESETKNLLLDGKMCTATLLDGIGVFVKKEGFISVFPRWYVTFDYDDIQKCFTGEEMPLYEFMKGRYEYNPRIHNNLRGIVELYNGVRK